MDKTPITVLGYQQLMDELKTLKSTARPAIIQAIAEAREHGDLSENAEYHSAREKQSYIEARIAELEDNTARAEIINPAELSSDNIVFGASVCIYDVHGDKQVTYQLVGELEADVTKGLLSIASPLARALLGRSVGEYFEFSTPSGNREYEIISIEYK